MLGCCFLVAEYASEYHKRKLAVAREKRSFEMRERVLVCGGGTCTCAGVSAPEESEELLREKDV